MRLTKQEFIDRFTPEEVEGLMAAEMASPAVKAWLFRFNSVTPDPDGTSIETTDSRTVAGVVALEHGGLIAAGRADEILGILLNYAGFSVGEAIRLLPPWDIAYPATYVITGFTPESNGVLLDIGGFALSNVEKV